MIWLIKNRPYAILASCLKRPPCPRFSSETKFGSVPRFPRVTAPDQIARNAIFTPKCPGHPAVMRFPTFITTLTANFWVRRDGMLRYCCPLRYGDMPALIDDPS